jgi:DNA-directed RNA polymerases I, II, and III subunit RPABC1
MSDSGDDDNEENHGAMMEDNDDNDVEVTGGGEVDDDVEVEEQQDKDDNDDDDDDAMGDDDNMEMTMTMTTPTTAVSSSSLQQQQQQQQSQSQQEDVVSAIEAIAAPSIRGGLNVVSARLFRVYRTIANMLDKRGYMIPRELRDITPLTFKSKFGEYPSRDNLTILVEKADDENAQLFVFFPDDDKVGVKPIKDYTDRMQAEGVTNAIIVLKVDITPFAKQAVQEMSEQFRIEHFKESELLIDITKHQLVPVHQVLTSNEKSELLKRYRLRETQLPRIQQNDPIARYYGMKRGTVVKIIRPSETAGRYVTYRVCM